MYVYMWYFLYSNNKAWDGKFMILIEYSFFTTSFQENLAKPPVKFSGGLA